MFDTSPVIRDACFAGIHALYTQAVIQGAFFLAKAKNDAGVAADMIDHLRRYIVLLFQPRGEKAKCKTHSSGMT